jgi:hypothetical protein
LGRLHASVDGRILTSGCVPVLAAGVATLLVAVILSLSELLVGAFGLSDAAPETVGLGREHESASSGAVPVPGTGSGATRAIVVSATAAATTATGVPAAATTTPAATAAIVVPAVAAVAAVLVFPEFSKETRGSLVRKRNATA